MKLAIFDIDGTLLTASTERRFWRYLLKRGHQGPCQIASYLLFVLRHWPAYGMTVLKKNKAYLTRLPVERVRGLAEEFVAAELVPELREPLVLRLERHLRAGDCVMLLSGTLEPIAAALGRALGAALVHATVCRERNGRYTAAPPEAHPFGEAKLEIAAQAAAALGTSLGDATAYGDSHHDLPLLRAVGRPVAVVPDARLLEAAREERWEIIGGDTGTRAAADYM